MKKLTLIIILIATSCAASTKKFDDINLIRLNQCTADKLKLERRLNNALDALNDSYITTIELASELEMCLEREEE